MSERRSGPRILIRRRVDVSWEESHEVAWGRDIGLGGMYIQCSDRPASGAEVCLTVRFRRAAAMSLPARVCRIDERGFAVQFCFVGKPEADTILRVLRAA